MNGQKDDITKQIALEQLDSEAIDPPIDNHQTFFNRYLEDFVQYDAFRDLLSDHLKEARETFPTRDNIARISSAVADAREQLSHFFSAKQLNKLDIVVFIGAGVFDGQGILLPSGPATFFDMALMNQHLENENFQEEVHVLHEMVHGLHYDV